MKRLYLLRHAKSSWDDPWLDDYERPLNPRGKRDLPFMAERFAAVLPAPDLFISSPAARAKTTAQSAAQALAYPVERIVWDKEVYFASAYELLRIIQATPSKIESLIVCGHNNALTELLNVLSQDFVTDNLPTTGMGGLSFLADSWSEVLPGKGSLVFFDYPKNYEELQNKPKAGHGV